MSRAEWEHVREAEAVPSSSSLFPTLMADADEVLSSEWTEEMWAVTDLAKRVAMITMNKVIVCQIYRSKATCNADYASGCVRFNLTRLGRGWFRKDNREAQLRLIIHELGHEFGGHLEEAYYNGLSKIGARLALTNPKDLVEEGRT